MNTFSLIKNIYLLSAIMVANVEAGPLSKLYITDANNNRVDVVQGDTIVSSFNTIIAPSFSILPGPIAVTHTIMTINYNNGPGAEYTLNGVATGVVYNTPNGPNVYTDDGTTDGRHIYTVNRDTGAVYQMEMNWTNQHTLFTTQASDSGITYDPSNVSLWLSNTGTGKVVNYALNGTKLSEFNTGLLGLVSTALDPLDNTLWFTVWDGTGKLKQYSKAGALLATVTIPNLSGWNLGMEAQTSIPEPGSLGLLATGLALLGYGRRREKS